MSILNDPWKVSKASDSVKGLLKASANIKSLLDDSEASGVFKIAVRNFCQF